MGYAPSPSKAKGMLGEGSQGHKNLCLDPGEPGTLKTVPEGPSNLSTARAAGAPSFLHPEDNLYSSL